MVSRAGTALVALAILAGAGPVAAASEEGHAHASAQAEAPGWLLSSDGKLQIGAVRAGDGGVSVDGANVGTDQVVACDCGEPTPSIVDQGVVLADGTLQRGMVKSLQAGKLSFVGDLGGPRELPTAAVAAVVVTGVPVGVIAQLPADFTGALLVNGDRVAGDPVFINARAVGVDNHRRVVQLLRARVLAVVLHSVVHGDQVRHWARLANGDRMDATGLGAKTITLAGSSSAGLTLPGTALRGLVSDGGRFESLLALTPSTSVGQQVFGEAAAPAPAGRSPGWPHAGGLRFEHAIIAPAGGEVAYDLGGHFATFFAVIARGDDSVGAPECRVLVDGHQVFTSGALSAPQGVAVAVSGGHELRLVVVDAAGEVVDNGGIPATALWGEPVLAQ